MPANFLQIQMSNLPKPLSVFHVHDDQVAIIDCVYNILLFHHLAKLKPSKEY